MAQLIPWIRSKLAFDLLLGRLTLLLFFTILAGHLLTQALLLLLWPDIVASGSESGPMPTAGSGSMVDALRQPSATSFGSRAYFSQIEFFLDLGVRIPCLMLVAWLGARWLLPPARRMIHADQNGCQCKHAHERGPDKPLETGPAVHPMSAEKWHQLLREDDFFVAAMSHDLRAPLTRLALRVGSLSDEEQQRGFWRDIGEMNSMITSTLHYLRGAPDPEPFVTLDVMSLLTSVADDQVACGHDVRITNASPPQPCAPLRTQTSSLRRCIGNLVDNAVRYGGSAEIRYTDAPDHICIEIRDHGPGIPDDELDKVLTPFYRLPGAHRRHNGGVGLGLAIANTIAQRLQGQLSLKNGADGGLVVTVTLSR